MTKVNFYVRYLKALPFFSTILLLGLFVSANYHPPLHTGHTHSHNGAKIEHLVKAKPGLADLVFVIPLNYKSKEELSAARMLYTKLLTLFLAHNPFEKDPTHTHFAIITYTPNATFPQLKLSKTRNIVQVTSVSLKPGFHVSQEKSIDLYRPLNLAFRHIESEARPNSVRVLVIFLSAIPTGHIQSIIEHLKGLYVEVHIITIGESEEINFYFDYLTQITFKEKILTFASYGAAKAAVIAHSTVSPQNDKDDNVFANTFYNERQTSAYQNVYRT